MNRPVKIQSKMNNMSLTQSQGEYKTRNGDLIASSDFNGLKQRWSLVPEKQNFIIKNCLSNSVLDVQSGSSDIYKTVICYKHHGDPNQVWKIKNYKNDNKTFYIENMKSTLVLEIEGGIDVQGMRIVQNRMYGNKNQLWTITTL